MKEVKGADVAPTPKRKTREPKLRNKRIAEGLCGLCGNDRGEDGTTMLCRPCAKKAIATTKRVRAAHVAAGRCANCRRPLAELPGNGKYRCRPCITKSNSKTTSRMKLNTWLRRKFAISIEQFDAMMVSQGGLCAICGKKPSKKRLGVDHCHVTGKVRGLLCDGCNSGIGFLKDSLELLENAAQYIRKHNALTVR